jgi:hypothetical protein
MGFLSMRLINLFGGLFLITTTQASPLIFSDSFDVSVDVHSDSAFPTTAHSRSNLVMGDGGMMIMIQPGGGTGDDDSQGDAGDDGNGNSDGDDDDRFPMGGSDGVVDADELLIEVNFKKHRFDQLLYSI